MFWPGKCQTVCSIKKLRFFDSGQKSGVYCKASLMTESAVADEGKVKGMSEPQGEAKSENEKFLTEAKNLM